jgi:hypothetical protein
LIFIESCLDALAPNPSDLHIRILCPQLSGIVQRLARIPAPPCPTTRSLLSAEETIQGSQRYTKERGNPHIAGYCCCDLVVVLIGDN